LHPNDNVNQYLTQSLGFAVKHIHWVSHSLTASQKAGNVTRSKELLHQHLPIKHHGWQFILTLDESWFYSAPDHEQTGFFREIESLIRLAHPGIVPIIGYFLAAET
jgi:hypothetical protein